MYKMNTKQIWNRFDRKVALCYTGYPERYNSLKTELTRVGLDDVEYIYDFPTPLKDILKGQIPTTNFTGKNGPFSCTIAHYKAIKQAYELGSKNLLILEDDIRFLKDISLIEKIVSSLPPDYDYAQFERAKPYEMLINEWLSLKRGNHINEYWIPFTNIRGGGCYALSRKAMEFMIHTMENVFVSKMQKLQSNDYYVSLGDCLKRVFCYPSVAVQTQITQSNSDIIEYWRRNELDGLRFEDYNTEDTIMPVGKHNFLESVDKVKSRTDIQAKGKDRITRVYSGWDNKPILQTFISKNEQKISNSGKIDGAYIWGYNNSDRNTKAIATALRDNAPVIFCEPGFISSGTTWADKKSTPEMRIEHSIMMDCKGQFFDATTATSLEDMINGDIDITEEEKKESRRLIDKIVSNKVSKYNHQSLRVPEIGRTGVRKVLVIDQSYGDCSIARGLASDNTFKVMLEKAIEENPGADVLVKTHPDAIAGKKGPRLGYYQYLNEKDYDNVYKVTMPVNPFSLMELVDTVYVCSSQFGIEALMAGKKVKVFGMPWYAGWGVTEDYQRCNRRNRKRTLEELFYIFYCIYTIWGMPEENRLCSIDEVIEKMVEYREKILSGTLKIIAKPSGYLDEGEW